MFDNEEKKTTLIIAIVTVLISILISWAVVTASNKRIDTMSTAVQITQDEQFQYAIKTQYPTGIWGVGKVTLNPVSDPRLIKTYGKIVVVAERYTRHETTTCTTTKNVTTCTTRIWYSWDHNSTKILQDSVFHFMGQEFSSSQVDTIFSNNLELGKETVYIQYLDKASYNYLYEGSTFFYSVGDIRYYFKTLPYEFIATLYVQSTNNGLLNIDKQVCGCALDNRQPNDIIKSEKDSKWFMQYVFPWLFPLIIVVCCVVYFYNNDGEY